MVLIVDDKPENIFSLRRTLELAGFNVDAAASGEEALRKILKSEYSLIILDVQMPGMDGFEVAEALSGYSKARDIPIIFLSAVNTDKKFIAKGYNSGGVDYVTKPIDPDIFLLKVKTLNRLYEQNRELEKARVSLLREVDERTKAEQEKAVRLQELRAVLEAMPQIAYTATRDGKVEYANEHWFIYSDTLHHMPEPHPDDAGTARDLEEALGSGRAHVAEVRIKNLVTGAWRWHLLRVSPVRERDYSIMKWVGTYTEIHEQKVATALLEARVAERTTELQHNMEELERSNMELQQFASVASHDLKEPLRKIQVFGSIIRSKYLNSSPDALQSMNRVMEAADRMSRLISDLLTYSRLSVDALFEPTDLMKIVREVMSDLQTTIEETAAGISVEGLPVIDAVPGQMRQVFQNLLANALKFRAPGVRPQISISAQLDGGQCTISLRDNGIGFEEEYAEKIFTIFQRLNAREAYEGTGIGLSIVRKIIEKHNGAIVARSRAGEGAEFIITLPISQSADAAPDTGNPAPGAGL